MKLKGGPYHAVVMLMNPPIDKIAAKTVAEIAQGTPLAVEDFWTENDCPEAQFSQWAAKGILSIDIEKEKYHGKAGSATEVVIRKLGIPQTPAIRQLLEILRDNNRTGYLKSATIPVAYIVRELYELDGYDVLDVINRSGMVVKAWLWDQENSPVPGRDDEAFKAEPELSQVVAAANGDYRDFTVGQYARALWREGRSAVTIRELAEFWIKGYQTVRRLIAEAEAVIFEDHGQNPDEFAITVPGGTLWGRWLETANPHVAKAASRNYHVLVVKHPVRGHVSVMTDGLDVSRLHAELSRREPKRWHRSGGSLINGGRIYIGVEPTGGNREGFIRLIKSFPPLIPQGRRIRHGR